MDESMMKKAAVVAESNEPDAAVKGIQALNVTHAPLKPHIEKSQALLASSQTCTLCSSSLPLSGASTLTCPSSSCTSKTHLTCLATHFLNTENNSKKTSTNNTPTPTPSLLPTTGSCPSCHTPLQWRDLVQELSLRMRGSKELEVLFKQPKIRKSRKNATAGAAAVEEEEEEDGEEAAANSEPDLDEEEDDEVVEDGWHQLSESESELEDLPEPVTTAVAVTAGATRHVVASSSKTGPSFRMPKENASAKAGAKQKGKGSAKKKPARSKGPEVMVEDSDLDDDVVIIA